MARLYGCTCSLSQMLLTPGYTRLSYTLPGHKSACKEAFRVYVMNDFSTICQDKSRRPIMDEISVMTDNITIHLYLQVFNFVDIWHKVSS